MADFSGKMFRLQGALVLTESNNIIDAIVQHQDRVAYLKQAIKESEDRIAELGKIDQGVIATVASYDRYVAAFNAKAEFETQIRTKVADSISDVFKHWDEWFACFDWEYPKSENRYFTWENTHYKQDMRANLIERTYTVALKTWSIADVRELQAHFMNFIKVVHEKFNTSQLRENNGYGMCPSCSQCKINHTWCPNCKKIDTRDALDKVRMDQDFPVFRV